MEILPLGVTVMAPFTTPEEARAEAKNVLRLGVIVALRYWDKQHADLAAQMTPAEQCEFENMIQEEANKMVQTIGFPWV